MLTEKYRERKLESNLNDDQPNQQQEFLEALFRDHVDDEYQIRVNITPGDVGDPRGSFQSFSSTDALAKEITRLEWDAYNVFLGTCLYRKGLPDRSKGKADDVNRIVAVWADIDAGPTKIRKSFKNAKEAMQFLDSLPLEPSIIVATAGKDNSDSGYHAYWLLKAPLEPNEGKSLAKGWVDTLKRKAADRGVELDSVGNIDRVLRVAGTYSTKHQRMVELVKCRPELRYTPEKIREHFVTNVPSPQYNASQSTQQAGERVRTLSQHDLQEIVNCLSPFWLDGNRHNLALALAGSLANSSVAKRQAEEIVRKIAASRSDPELSGRISDVATTYQKHDSGENITGIPTLQDLIQDSAVLKRITSILKPQQNNPNQDNWIKFMDIAAQAKYFKGDDNRIYVQFPRGNHDENHAAMSKDHKTWLYYEAHKQGIRASEEMVKTANLIQEGKLHEEGTSVRPVFKRFGVLENHRYLDLLRDDWEVVEITPDGWRIVGHSPVAFTRSNSAKPLPIPLRGGSLELLDQVINVKPEDRILVISWLIACLLSHTAYPILSIHGSQGSAKTTTCRNLINIIDPKSAPLKAITREVTDFMVSVDNNAILAYDNVSYIDRNCADWLCRVATGAGYSRRELYTDNSEYVFSGQRPILLNGIPDLTGYDDLADRALVIRLPEITNQAYKESQAIDKLFEEKLPEILGGLLDLAVRVLKLLDQVTLKERFRMADFTRLAVATGQALEITSDVVIGRLRENAESQAEKLLDDNIVAQAIQVFVDKMIKDGNTQELFNPGNTMHIRLGMQMIPESMDDYFNKHPKWPKSSVAFGRELSRLEGNLKKRGIHVTEERTRAYRNKKLSFIPVVPPQNAPLGPETTSAEAETILEELCSMCSTPRENHSWRQEKRIYGVMIYRHQEGDALYEHKEPSWFYSSRLSARN